MICHFVHLNINILTAMHHLKIPGNRFRLGTFAKKITNLYASPNFTTTIDTTDAGCYEYFLQSPKTQARNYFTTDFNLQYCILGEEHKDVTNMTAEEIGHVLKDLLSKNKHTQITEIIEDCIEKRKITSDSVVKELFKYYSLNGKVDTVMLLQKYCLEINPGLFIKNGEFLHYVAKAQCMKGNSGSGLSVLKQAYEKYSSLRGFYRIILRELIYDIVLNRSQASLVILKKYVLELSEVWSDHYPLVCFWHICWSSNWFSDQMLSDDLLKSSEALRNILKDRCTIFSINVLREFNEDAVIRLLQSLLKYNMMDEYTKVLQLLFSYKLNNRDLKGCTEIIKNCQVLGITLSTSQQGRYIKMLINNYQPTDDPPPKPQSKIFKLKF